MLLNKKIIKIFLILVEISKILLAKVAVTSTISPEILTKCVENDDGIIIEDRKICVKMLEKEDLEMEEVVEVCEDLGGILMETGSEQNRMVLMKLINQKCHGISCPRVCLNDNFNTSISLERNPIYLEILNRPRKKQLWEYERKTIVPTQKMSTGDAMFLEIDQIRPGTLEVFELIDFVVDEMKNDEQASVLFQMAIFRNFSDMKNGELVDKLQFRTGYIQRKNDQLNVEKLVTHEFLLKDEIANETSQIIKIHFAEIGKTILTADGLLDDSWEFETPEIDGRLFLSREKFGIPKNQLLDVYVMKGGNCRKSSYQNQNLIENGTINCHWTNSMQTVPVYSCEPSKFVVCQFPTDIKFENNAIILPDRNISRGNSTGKAEKLGDGWDESFDGLWKMAPGLVLTNIIIGSLTMIIVIFMRIFGKK
ncbi:unnamed protein product [Caenorhabditis angaria]|uniref:Uncharacterized protein n=1 Tax=Caenorhabditis angaria TaxID=860376 RepID=A0A9P1ISZ4_9PELO|nr:unnamed protein product [Caenorhabditis angaria]